MAAQVVEELEMVTYATPSVEEHRKEEGKDNNTGFVQVRENWKSRGKSEKVFRSLESQGI